MEDDIIIRLKAHEAMAQRQLYEHLREKMLAVCKRYVKSDEDAIEILQTSFLKVFSSMHQYRSEGNFEGWVRRIVINKSLDFVKMNKSRHAMMTSMDPLPETTIFFDPEGELDKEVVLLMIRKLPSITQNVFRLYVLDGYSHKEIASQLCFKESTSRWHLSLAREKLKSMWRKLQVHEEMMLEAC